MQPAIERPMSGRAIIKAINTAYAELEHIYAPLAGWGGSLLDRSYQAALEGERLHTAFGTRLLGRRPRQAASAVVRAKYFACRWAIENPSPPKSWLAASEVRGDAFYAYALGHLLMNADETKGRFAEWRTTWRPVFEQIDYARSLSGD